MADYHSGELEVQARAGVQNEGARMSKSIRSTIPLAARDFLSEQQMIVAGTVALDGHVWASVLSGEPGFARALDEQNIEISAIPHPDDPLAANLQAGATAIGLIAIDFATHRRMRINGGAQKQRGAIRVRAEEVYANCHKYIQARFLLPQDVDGHVFDGMQCAEKPVPQALHTTELTNAQKEWIEKADTFFIASSHRNDGADASHRGGLPGFVKVEGLKRLVFPDYAGNRMFQTLGNISAEPHAGLLFLDFERGGTLQLSGEARIIWEQERVAAFAGAQRLVEFEIDRVIETPEVLSLRWQFGQYSPVLPVDSGDVLLVKQSQ